MLRWPAASLGVCFVLSTTGAFADAVPGPPKNCPPGSIGQTSHSGQWCGPSVCKTDANCKNVFPEKANLARCDTISLCVRRDMVRTNHRMAPAPDGAVAMHERAHAVGECKDGACDDPAAKCETERRCNLNDPYAPSPSASTGTPDGGAAEPSASRGCGCGKKTAGPKSGALLGLLVGAWLLRRAHARPRSTS